jgi:hypothetical protein
MLIGPNDIPTLKVRSPIEPNVKVESFAVKVLPPFTLTVRLEPFATTLSV